MMIIRVEQQTAKDISYKIRSKQIEGTAFAPFEFAQANLTILLNGLNPIYIYHKDMDLLKDILMGRIKTDCFAEEICDGDKNKIGEIRNYLGKPAELELFGHSLQMYRVSMGKKGQYVCCYDGGQLIGMIEKDIKVKNDLDTYTIFVEDDKYANALCVMCLNYDISNYRKTQTSIFTFTKSNRYDAVTSNPDILNKYDPSFIPRVKAMEGIVKKKKSS